MRALYRIVWVTALLAIVGMSCWFLSAPRAAPTVAPMVGYVSNDKSLSLLRPGDWKARTVSSQAISSRIAFEPDASTRFTIDTSLTGSLLADIARSNGSGGADLSALQGMPGMPSTGAGDPQKQKSPLELMHAASLHAMSKSRSRYPDFEEGATQPVQIDGVEALSTAFTYKQNDLLSKQEMVGTYITVLQKDREVDVTATCPKEAQKTLKPVFDQMISSIRLGQTGG